MPGLGVPVDGEGGGDATYLLCHQLRHLLRHQLRQLLRHLHPDDVRRVSRRDQSSVDSALDFRLDCRLDFRLGRRLDCLLDSRSDCTGNGSGSGRVATDRTCRCESPLEALPAAGLRTDGGQAAVIVEEVEAELGIVQVFRQVAHRESPLTGVFGGAVRAAQHAGEVGIECRLFRQRRGPRCGTWTSTQGCREFGDGSKVTIDEWRQIAKPESLVPLQGLVGQQPLHDIGNHRLPRPRPNVVDAREVAADRIDFSLLPVELVEPFHRKRVGRRNRQRRQPDRQQRLAKLRARQPQLAHVEVVDGVDAVGNEGALAPVEHVPAEAHVDNRIACVERSGDIGVEQFEILADAILRCFAQLGAFPCPVLVLEVDESGGPDERTEVAGTDVEVGRELRRVADDSAVVVQIAVVAVCVCGQRAVALLDTEGHPVRDRGVQAPLEFAVAELDRLHGYRVQEPAKDDEARRQRGGAEMESRAYWRPRRRTERLPNAGRSGHLDRAGLTNVPHANPLSWRGWRR